MREKNFDKMMEVLETFKPIGLLNEDGSMPSRLSGKFVGFLKTRAPEIARGIMLDDTHDRPGFGKGGDCDSSSVIKGKGKFGAGKGTSSSKSEYNFNFRGDGDDRSFRGGGSKSVSNFKGDSKGKDFDGFKGKGFNNSKGEGKSFSGSKSLHRNVNPGANNFNKTIASLPTSTSTPGLQNPNFVGGQQMFFGNSKGSNVDEPFSHSPNDKHSAPISSDFMEFNFNNENSHRSGVRIRSPRRDDRGRRRGSSADGRDNRRRGSSAHGDSGRRRSRDRDDRNNSRDRGGKGMDGPNARDGKGKDNYFTVKGEKGKENFNFDNKGGKGKDNFNFDNKGGNGKDNFFDRGGKGLGKDNSEKDGNGKDNHFYKGKGKDQFVDRGKGKDNYNDKGKKGAKNDFHFNKGKGDDFIWPLLWSRIFAFSETAQSAEAAELSKCMFS